MARDADWKQELERLAEKLRDPFRMRMAVAVATIAIMCLGISDPLQGRIRDRKSEFQDLKAKARTAEEVMLLRNHWEAVQDRIIKGKSSDVVVSHLINTVHQEDVELIRIDTQSPEKLGPLQSIRVMIDLSGSFQSLMQLLYQLDTNQYLIRIESIAITPKKQGPDGTDEGLTTMMLGLRIIREET